MSTTDNSRIPHLRPPTTNLEHELAVAKAEVSIARQDANELYALNQALRSEVEMLRKLLTDCDNHRIRLIGMCSALGGRLHGIKSIIDDAVRDAVRNGMAAVEQAAEKAKADPPQEELYHQTITPLNHFGESNHAQSRPDHEHSRPAADRGGDRSARSEVADLGQERPVYR